MYREKSLRAGQVSSRVPCSVCRSERAEIFVTIPNVPVLCNVLWDTPEAARDVARIDVPLALCPDCGHVFNPAFDPAHLAYDVTYENSLHFSPRFQQYVDVLAVNLVAQHDLHGKQIVEIGSGKGDFLAALCDLGNNTGVGFDPSYSRDADSAYSPRTRFVQDYYSEAYSEYEADFICSRHTLEHIPDPGQFVQMLRRAIGARATSVFIEVPNGAATLRQMAIWDIIYEHCSYFTAPSLRRLFAQNGFDVLSIDEQYDGQFLTLECVPTAHGAQPAAAEDVTPLTASAERFALAYAQKVDDYHRHINRLRDENKFAVIWGAGSKGITFLNVLEADDVLPYVVDINPRKQGHYITGTGQKIIAPAQLAEIRPDVVFVMNEIYLGEIRHMLDGLGVSAALITG